ncbi:unnamed protein product [Heligmosomoides polygyrus]|uniref:Uncharacterized protein n=1 Tax=Heligmosomoides polygyrus TaxID=6339 RepID=A0A183FKP4_HELPZ|nr:unnamed protein product [Heligmosomoides polygyrus]
MGTRCSRREAPSELWVCAHGPVYWKLFTKSTTMDSKDMVNEIEEMDLRLELIQWQRVKKILIFDNAAPIGNK